MIEHDGQAKPADRAVQNVFVLSTGRCGSVTFARACEQITNFTSGHETRWKRLDEDRLDFPDGHIEVDNRLAWYLGRLDKKFGDEATYVHLFRDEREVAKSFDRRWMYPGTLALAYARGIVQTPLYNVETCLDLVRTITTNIELFLKDKTDVHKVDLADPKEAFERFWLAIGAEGDLNAAKAVFDRRHNKSQRADHEDEERTFADSESKVFHHLDRVIDMLHEERRDLRKQLRITEKHARSVEKQLGKTRGKLAALKRRVPFGLRRLARSTSRSLSGWLGRPVVTVPPRGEGQRSSDKAASSE